MARQEFVVLARELGCIPQLIFRDARRVAMESRGVMLLLPWDRMGLASQTQEAAERGYGINDVTTDLLDHEALDRPDLLSVRIVNRGALDAAALNQRVSRTCRRLVLWHC